MRKPARAGALTVGGVGSRGGKGQKKGVRLELPGGVAIFDDGLTEKQLRFCSGVQEGLTLPQAAKRAGYPPTNAQLKRLLQNEKVGRFLQAHFEEVQEKTKISRDQVIDGIKTAIDQAILQADPTAQIAGWKEIARILGYYQPEVKEVRLTLNQETKRAEVQMMTEEDLLKLAAEEGASNVIEGEFNFIPAPSSLPNPQNPQKRTN